MSTFAGSCSIGAVSSNPASGDARGADHRHGLLGEPCLESEPSAAAISTPLTRHYATQCRDWEGLLSILHHPA
ncbi:MAG: hypothetical protein RIG62_10135 [Cyclobacteriaceae bacterium]